MSGPETGRERTLLASVGWRRRSDRPEVQRHRTGSSTPARLPELVAGFLFVPSHGIDARQTMRAAKREHHFMHLCRPVPVYHHSPSSQCIAPGRRFYSAGVIIGLLAARH